MRRFHLLAEISYCRTLLTQKEGEVTCPDYTCKSQVVGFLFWPLTTKRFSPAFLYYRGEIQQMIKSEPYPLKSLDLKANEGF